MYEIAFIVLFAHNYGSGGRAAERQTVNRGDGGSIPPVPDMKHSPHICLCFSEEALKAGGLFCLLSRGSKRSRTGGKCVTYSGLTNYREGKLLKPMTIMVSKLTGDHYGKNRCMSLCA